MDDFVYRCRKQITKLQNEIPLPELVVAIIQMLQQVERAQERVQRTYLGIQTMLYILTNGPNEWLPIQAVRLHEHKSNASQWNRHLYLGISNDKKHLTMLFCYAFHEYLNIITVLMYYLSIPCSSNCLHVYSSLL